VVEIANLALNVAEAVHLPNADDNSLTKNTPDFSVFSYFKRLTDGLSETRHRTESDSKSKVMPESAAERAGDRAIDSLQLAPDQPMLLHLASIQQQASSESPSTRPELHGNAGPYR